MGKSILGTIYDLLSFYKQGNYEIFDRCFRKTMDYLSLNPDNTTLKRYRNWAFHFLHTTGYIDVVRSGTMTNWALSPAALVQRGENDFILIGGSNDETSIHLAKISHNLCRQLKPSGPSFSGDISFFPNVIQLIVTAKEAEAIATQAGLNLSLNYQDRLFEHLPSLQSIFNSILIELDESSVFEPNTAKIFSLQDQKWKPYGEMCPREEGLFKSEFRYAKSEYFVATSGKALELKVFRVKDHEWALICFLNKLNIKIQLRYHLAQQKLSIARTFEDLHMPTLLERCFRSGTLLSPEHISGWSIYSNISCRNLWRLVAKFPIFQVETYE